MAKLDKFIIDGTAYEIVPEIAPLFNESDSYSVGDCVIHNAVLYKFTANHAAGAWTGSDAVEVTVGKELTDLKTDLNANIAFEEITKFTIGKMMVTTGSVGTTVIPSESINGNFKNVTVQCSPGDRFTITGVGGHGPRLWTFFNNDNLILGNSAGGASATNLVIIAPQSATKLIVNFDISQNADARLFKGENIDYRINNNLYSESFYNEVTYNKSVNYDSDTYFVEIPKMTNDNCLIGVRVDKDDINSPLKHAQDIGSNVTINCSMAIMTDDGTCITGNLIGDGIVLNHNDIDDTQIVPNKMGYLTINADRSFKTYPINTTLEELQADNVQNCFIYYYPLVVNNNIADFDSVICNEPGVALTRHPRSAIGIKDDGTIILFACDGRTEFNKGMSSSAVAMTLKSKGCSNAWMLDGGGSTSLTFCGEKLNRNDDNYGTTDRLITTTLNVLKPGKLQSITTITSFIGAEKQRIIQQIVPYINYIKSEHESILSLIGLQKLNYSYGYINAYHNYIDITAINYNASYQYIVATCSEGDQFYVTGRGTYAALVWAFIDANGNSLAKASENDTLTNYLITAPKNSSHVIIQANDAYYHAAYKKITGIV